MPKIQPELAIAKSSGVNLITHNTNVAVLSKHIAQNYLGVDDEELLNIIYISGLVHDIAKGYYDYQELLFKDKKTMHKFRHNEFGAAFIYKYLNQNVLNVNYHDGDNLLFVTNSTYWHHGISNKMSHYCFDEIINDFNSDDIDSLKNILVELMGKESLLDEPRSGMRKTPKYCLNESLDPLIFNQKLNIIRTCVISADRIVSSLEEDDMDMVLTENNINSIVGDILSTKIFKSKIHQINPSKFSGVDMVRYEKQQEIVNNCDRTTIINAPGGFGKTMIGILWSLINNRKLIWVSPRNEVSRSIYKSIIDDIKTLGLDISVELYLTGNTIERNHETTEEFCSDIIITNIDNYLVTSYSDKLSDRLFLVNSANVVFDEYHEFVSSDAYFACFINIMKGRHRNTNSNTLLLSATPFDIADHWDTLSKKTKILPKLGCHYPAIHQYKYSIKVTENFIHNDVPNELTVVNSIFESQLLKKNAKNCELIHSGFVDNTVREKMNKLLLDYGKYSDNEKKDYGMIGALMVRSSLNISFKNLNCSVTSPQDDLQKITRCNRFGEQGNNSKVKFLKLRDSNGIKKFSGSESAVINMLYDEKLLNDWFEVLKRCDNKEVSLDEFYEIFNKFNSDNSDKIRKLINAKHISSLFSLSENAYPFKCFSKKNNDIITAGSNKLRTTGNEIFFLAKQYNNPDKYVGIFSTRIYKNFTEDFSEDENRIKRDLLKSMKTIMSGDNPLNLDYSDILGRGKNENLMDEIRKIAKKSNTPYIRYDVVYHPEFGLIKKNNIDKLI